MYNQNAQVGNTNFTQTKSLVNVSNFLPSGKSLSNGGGVSRANQRFVSTGRKWNQKEQGPGVDSNICHPDPKKDRASTANNYKSRGLAEALQPEKVMSSNTIGGFQRASNNSHSNAGLD